MDRLSALISLGVGALAAGALGACDATSDPAAPPARTDSAKVAAHQAASTDAFCDQHATDATGPLFQWPELGAGSVAPAPAKSWRWINLWATWCKPCREEMPRIQGWRDKLAAAGTPVDLVFASIDDGPDDIAAFTKLHPETPPSLTLATKDKGAAWLHTLGLDNGAIPIHLFVSPAGHVRCVRAGSVRVQDYGAIAKLLAE